MSKIYIPQKIPPRPNLSRQTVSRGKTTFMKHVKSGAMTGYELPKCSFNGYSWKVGTDVIWNRTA